MSDLTESGKASDNQSEKDVTQCKYLIYTNVKIHLSYIYRYNYNVYFKKVVILDEIEG